MDFNIGDVRIEDLTGRHDLNSFRNQTEAIQNYCRDGLLKDHDRRIVRSLVAVNKGDPRIIGFCTLYLSSTSHDQVGRTTSQNFWQTDEIPTIQIGMLGVFTALQRKGVGKLLMRKIFERVVLISNYAGVHALTLKAVNEAAALYYQEKFEFQRFTPKGLAMFLPVDTIRYLDLEPEHSE